VNAAPPRAVYVGCAGRSVPKEHARHFPAGGSHLERYASRFPAVEINSSFYRPHRPATYARWAAAVPPDFRFAVKVPREVTHRRHLAGAADLLDRFLAECGGLGEELGRLLVQLPPNLPFAAGVAGRFFGVCGGSSKGTWCASPGTRAGSSRRSRICWTKPGWRRTRPWCTRPPSWAGGPAWRNTACTRRPRCTAPRPAEHLAQARHFAAALPHDPGHGGVLKSEHTLLRDPHAKGVGSRAGPAQATAWHALTTFTALRANVCAELVGRPMPASRQPAAGGTPEVVESRIGDAVEIVRALGGSAAARRPRNPALSTYSLAPKETPALVRQLTATDIATPRGRLYFSPIP
jgi:Protein of unknown function DUF72